MGQQQGVAVTSPPGVIGSRTPFTGAGVVLISLTEVNGRAVISGNAGGRNNLGESKASGRPHGVPGRADARHGLVNAGLDMTDNPYHKRPRNKDWSITKPGKGTLTASPGTGRA